MPPKYKPPITKRQREIRQLRQALTKTADVQIRVLKQPPEEPILEELMPEESIPEEPVIDSSRFVGLPRAHQSLLLRIASGMQAGDSKGLNDSITEAVDEGISVNKIGDAMIEGMHGWFPSKERSD